MAVLPIHDPVQIFALVMLVILAVPVLCRVARVPPAFGLILAGVVLGPHVLNALERDATMRLLGTVGLLYIMFQAGLEIDLHQFLRQRSHSALFGTLTFAIPMAIGVPAAILILRMDPLSAVLLGSMFASHTLLTFPTVSRLGLAKSRPVATIVGGTMLTDTAAFVVLAAIAAMTRGDPNVHFWLRFVGCAVLATVLVLWGLSRLGRWFLRHVATDDTVEYVFALTAVFACAVLLQAAGMEAIIGAFLAGLALNRLVPENGVLMNRVRFVGSALFIPFFLISVGMLVNPRLPFESRAAALVALVMTTVALFAKWLAADLSRRLLRYDKDEGGLLLGLSVNQAAATLAAVMVGFELGLFSEAIVTGTVLMILVTCFAGAWITDHYALRCARRLAQRPAGSAAPVDRIMVPLANPSTADRLMGLALLVRQPGSHEPVYPLAVVPESPERTRAAVAEAEHMLGSAVVHAVAAAVPVIPVTRVDANVATGICRAMMDVRAAGAVIGWTGEVSSLQRVFGRVLDQLLDQSEQMLLVYRATAPMNTVQRLLVLQAPLVGRHPGMGVVKHCLQGLAAQLGASLQLLQVRGDEGGDWPRAAPPPTPVALPSWAVALPSLDRLQPGPTDAIVLLSARRGALGWQPALDRLPRLLAARYRDTNLIVAYPPEGQGTPEPAGAVLSEAAESAGLVTPADVILGLDGLSVEDGVDRLLRHALATRSDAIAAIAPQRDGPAAPPPLELVPGAILVHIHVTARDALAGSRVLVGINRSGFALSGSTRPAECLFLLLSPVDQPAEVHLQKLAAIARCLRTSGRLARVLAAQSAADVAAAFSG